MIIRYLEYFGSSCEEIIASAGLSTNWNDILPMLDDEEIAEQLRLASHIIFRAKLVLEEMEKNPSSKNLQKPFTNPSKTHQKPSKNPSKTLQKPFKTVNT